MMQPSSLFAPAAAIDAGLDAAVDTGLGVAAGCGLDGGVSRILGGSGGGGAPDGGGGHRLS